MFHLKNDDTVTTDVQFSLLHITRGKVVDKNDVKKRETSEPEGGNT